MLCEPTLQSNDNYPWKTKNNNIEKYDARSGAPSPSLKSTRKTSSQQYASGTRFVPDSSFKTSGSPNTKSITPDKDHDVIMDEVDDEGGAAAAASGSENGGSERVAVAAAARSSGGEGSADSGDDDNSSGGDKDVDMKEADESEAENPDVKGGSVKSNPTETLPKALDRKVEEESGDAGAAKSSNDDSGENKGGESVGGGINGNSDSESKSNNHASTSNPLKENDSKKEGGGGNEKEPDTPEANLPLLVGTLAFSDRDNLRRHIIRGNWKYEFSHATPPQPFELIRTIPLDEELKELPKDGEFNGSFSLQNVVTSSKGKTKMRTFAVQESGVKLVFKKKDGAGTFAVNGTGTNEYGVFKLFGTATKNVGEDDGDDPTYSVSVHKDYISLPQVPPSLAGEEGKTKDKKRKHAEADKADDEPRPPPTELPVDGLFLRGKLVRNTSDELSLDNTAVHRITGLWAMGGQSKILEDPGTCEKFEYEHKCSGDSTIFPLSGRYTGFFCVFDGGVRSKIPERDVTIRFKMNTEDYWNVEGKGSNIYGKYNITGTLSEDGTIKLCRQYQARKQKASKKSAHVKISAPKADVSSLKPPPKSAVGAASSNLLTFDDVNSPSEGEVPSPLDPPGQFTAISRGILKIEDDGTHTCSGSWAMTNEHFQGGLTSKYHFGIEAHSAAKDAKVMLAAMKSSGLEEEDDRQIKNTPSPSLMPMSLANSTFPIDSTQYKGSFKLRKAASRTTTIIDHQIVLKYVKNSGGSFNVYGKGTNEMGTFDLVGTLILQGKSNGLMQLYRLYPTAPEPPPVAQGAIGGMSSKSSKVFQGGLTEKATFENSGPVPAMKPPERFIPSMSGLQRQSARMSRLPSRLEEDNPEAEMDRYMEKCRQILSELQDLDTQKIFAMPVDPIAHNIPTYLEVITEPMDLGTIEAKMDNNEIDSPEEFARLVRLTFENAITFNSMPDNLVHINARSLLVAFTKKFGSIDKAFNAAKKNRKLTKAERQELRRKEKEAAKEAKRREKQEKERKRKAEVEASNESKRMKIENVLAANKSAMAAIAQAAPNDPDANMTRSEFNLLVKAIQQVQEQIVGLHKIIKKTAKSAPAVASTSGNAYNKVTSYAPSALSASSLTVDEPTFATTHSSKPKKKKPKKESDKPKNASLPSSPSPKTFPIQAPLAEDLQPLSFEEQEALSESINDLPERLLPGAMQIIRESDFVNDDDDEIDLDIDQLDTKTQRKLQSFVMENVKTKKKKKQPKKQKAAALAESPDRAPEVHQSPPATEPDEDKPKSSVNRLPGGKSFFALGDDDSDDDKDDDEDEDLQTDFASAFANPTAQDDDAKEVTAGGGSGDDDDSDKDDNDEDNDLWDKARKEAETSKALAEDKAKREEKIKRQAELDAQKRMAEAQELGEQARMKRAEEGRKAEEAREEEERKVEEAREEARQAAIAEVNNVQNTVDLDETRELMKQYENEFNDNYSAGASPSSDFGF